MVDPVGGGAVPPPDSYKSECQRAAKLFHESLDQYANEKDYKKKYEFEKVIHDSLKIMNEACRGMRKEEALRQEEKLAKDFDDYKTQLTPEKLYQLHQEADGVEKSI